MEERMLAKWRRREYLADLYERTKKASITAGVVALIGLGITLISWARYPSKYEILSVKGSTERLLDVAELYPSLDEYEAMRLLALHQVYRDDNGRFIAKTYGRNVCTIFDEIRSDIRGGDSPQLSCDSKNDELSIKMKGGA